MIPRPGSTLNVNMEQLPAQLIKLKNIRVEIVQIRDKNGVDEIANEPATLSLIKNE